MKFLRSILVLVLFLAPLSFAGCADKSDGLSEVQKTQKEVLAKLNVIEANQEKMLKFFQPRKPEIDLNKVHNIPVGSSIVKGSMSAPVTIVEFSDFQCPYCSKLQPTLKKILDAYPDEVRLVFKNFPLSFHKQAMNAAKAFLAAAEQGKAWEMHDLIFDKYNSLTEPMFKEFAQKLGMDTEKFSADFKSNKYDKQIQAEMNLGNTVGVRGTPTLFVNGKRMAGRSFNDFKTSIDRILKK